MYYWSISQIFIEFLFKINSESLNKGCLLPYPMLFCGLIESFIIDQSTLYTKVISLGRHLWGKTYRFLTVAFVV